MVFLETCWTGIVLGLPCLEGALIREGLVLLICLGNPCPSYDGKGYSPVVASMLLKWCGSVIGPRLWRPSRQPTTWLLSALPCWRIRPELACDLTRYLPSTSIRMRSPGVRWRWPTCIANWEWHLGLVARPLRVASHCSRHGFTSTFPPSALILAEQMCLIRLGRRCGPRPSQVVRSTGWGTAGVYWTAWRRLRYCTSHHTLLCMLF